MIFAADLDRTLIFSSRTLAPGGAPLAVEYREDEAAGFMTPGALDTLRRIQHKSVFFVNTMRGMEQAQRVSFVRDGSCPYLSLQNGLYLYQNGEEDRVWADHVRRTVQALPLDLTEGIQAVLETLPGIDCLSKRYAYLAVFFVEVDAFDDDACAKLADDLSAVGWSLQRQRKKLYLLPRDIHKGTVLARVMDLAGERESVGFGDSTFDLPMLQACTAAYTLQGCELDGQDWGFSLRISRALAQDGSEEVLREIAKGL